MGEDFYCESLGGYCYNNFECDKCEYGGLCMFCRHCKDGICLISKEEVENLVIKKCKKFDKGDISTCY